MQTKLVNKADLASEITYDVNQVGIDTYKIQENLSIGKFKNIEQAKIELISFLELNARDSITYLTHKLDKLDNIIFKGSKTKEEIFSITQKLIKTNEFIKNIDTMNLDSYINILPEQISIPANIYNQKEAYVVDTMVVGKPTIKKVNMCPTHFEMVAPYVSTFGVGYECFYNDGKNSYKFKSRNEIEEGVFQLNSVVNVTLFFDKDKANKHFDNFINEEIDKLKALLIQKEQLG